jgi:hypothetical protein
MEVLERREINIVTTAAAIAEMDTWMEQRDPEQRKE